MESWPRGPCGLFRFCVRPPGFRCFNLNVAPVRICSRCLGLARWRTLPVLSSARLHPDTSPRALRSAFESMRRDGLKIITYTTGEAVEPRLVSVIQAHIRYTLTHFFFHAFTGWERPRRSPWKDRAIHERRGLRSRPWLEGHSGFSSPSAGLVLDYPPGTVRRRGAIPDRD